MPAAKPLVALTTFVITTKDGDVIVRRGEVVPSTHAAAKSNPELFQPHDPAKPLDPPPAVEAAAVAPTRKRS